MNFIDLFERVCANAHNAVEWVCVDGKQKRIPMRYRRWDLTQWAEEAFEKGESVFYCEPVDERNPYGALQLCEPKFVYQCKRPLTVEEFEELRELLQNA